MEAEQRETKETEATFRRLDEQKEQLLALMKKRKEIADAEWVKWIEAGEEESIVEITMETSTLDYSVVEEQGQFPKALSEEEERVYGRLVTVEMNQIQWKYEALTYLNSLTEGNRSAQQEGDET